MKTYSNAAYIDQLYDRLEDAELNVEFFSRRAIGSGITHNMSPWRALEYWEKVKVEALKAAIEVHLLTGGCLDTTPFRTTFRGEGHAFVEEELRSAEGAEEFAHLFSEHFEMILDKEGIR